ncbi:hypothetical protein A3J17_00510 [Candidatus Curtissbacteria bacterium RIFCSPLOWO2_02_FULL_40_11]|uniref:DUF86 domain-containing protein n=2 Tax=Candidatus Curtissiibacteriota TaxID=1752717 RepID=A0A1F5G7Z7_9BACT|nr:MAG: hypothetical protein A3D04_03280 [Candidatus Curtissbacteria bacterium RIFCSPHIGHO2_02_FULL_40_16b]OGE01540.1 MAG: hypothetical protein A3J17_00510 [Candidatus Curtissbacteria bacterium RIFCSPLOWO2_02_FULL_40_11]OGE13874.1 MAG: hypothetical protein A3G14_01855 [Candidatus Curtissbacteria bacterium RIFCSPLOWO2_12_FULL_38_9]
MQRDIGLYLDDILESIEKIEEYTHDLSEEEFSRNTETQDAVLRRLAIIGEAVKHLPEDLKEKHKQIPWKQIAGARDIFVHEYFGVGIERVWETIQEDLPELKKVVEEII